MRMEETDVEFDLSEHVENRVSGVGVVGDGGGVDLVRGDMVVGGRHCDVCVCGRDVLWWLVGDDDEDRGRRAG